MDVSLNATVVAVWVSGNGVSRINESTQVEPG